MIFRKQPTWKFTSQGIECIHKAVVPLFHRSGHFGILSYSLIIIGSSILCHQRDMFAVPLGLPSTENDAHGIKKLLLKTQVNEKVLA